MRIVVTGGAGFIGSHVVDAYIKEGHEVLVIDNLSTGSKKNLNKKALFKELDLRDKGKLIEVIDSFKPEIINHHAFISSVRLSEENTEEFLKNTIAPSLNILDVSKEYIAQFIFASSGAVYGEKEVPIKETEKEEPVNPYGISKLTVEKLVKYYSKKFNFKYTILRYSNVYGPRQIPIGESGVVSIFIEELLEGRPLTLFGDGKNTRDFIFVLDVVRANSLVLRKEGIFNISTGVETSIIELVRKIEEISGKRVKKVFLKRDSGVKRNSLDPALAKQTLGFIPNFSLKEGIREMLRFYEKI